MKLTLPLKTTVQQTLHGIRNKRARRDRSVQQFGMMMASRVLRPAHVEVRSYREARNIPDTVIVPESPAVSPQPTSKPQAAALQVAKRSVRVAHMLGSLMSELTTALSHPHARLQRAPLDRRAAISAARRSMARPLQSRTCVRTTWMSRLAATVKAREAQLSTWWHKIAVHERHIAAQRRLLLRFR